METITVELCKKDITVYERALQDEETAVKKSQGKMKLSPTYIETMKRVGEYLHAGMPLFGQKWTEGEVQIIREKMKSLITTKPTVYIINLTRKHYEKKKNKWLPKIKEWIDAHGGGPMIPFSVEFEEDFKDMEQAEKDELEKVKVISKLNKMVRAGYDELALQSYFTAGEKEVRAWTVQAGSTAPQAAAVIHEDFQRGFIKAEIAGWSDFDSLQDTKGMDKVKVSLPVRAPHPPLQSPHFPFASHSDRSQPCISVAFHLLADSLPPFHNTLPPFHNTLSHDCDFTGCGQIQTRRKVVRHAGW
jgi:obg-like ATPase 1